MIERVGDPRTEDTIVFELLSTPSGGGDPEVVGRAEFRGGRTTVDAPDAISIAVEELLQRAFVDRVRSDERPRGYRRSGRGIVDMLVPGMPEHFISRMRGLWLSYPDGSLITARPSSDAPPAPRRALPDLGEGGPPIVDPSVRRATLAIADETVGGRPLVRAHAPESGLRPEAAADRSRPISRTDCGWLT